MTKLHFSFITYCAQYKSQHRDPAVRNMNDGICDSRGLILHIVTADHSGSRLHSVPMVLHQSQRRESLLYCLTEHGYLASRAGGASRCDSARRWAFSKGSCQKAANTAQIPWDVGHGQHLHNLEIVTAATATAMDAP